MIALKYSINDDETKFIKIDKTPYSDAMTALSALLFVQDKSVVPALGFFMGHVETLDDKAVAKCFTADFNADSVGAKLVPAPVKLTIFKHTKAELGGDTDAFILLKNAISSERISALEANYQPIVVSATKIELHTSALLLTEQAKGITCTPMPSAWSRPITWEMVNRPASNDGISVSADSAGSPNFWIDLSKHNNVKDFFVELQQRFAFHSPIELDTSATDSVRFRFVGESYGGIPVEQTYERRGEFYVHAPHYAGSSAEFTLCLADAFDEPPTVINCVGDIIVPE